MAIQFMYSNRKVDLNLMTNWGVDLEVSEIAEMRKRQTDWYRKGMGYGHRMTFVMPMDMSWYRCEICGEPVINCDQGLGTCELCEVMMAKLG